jgi:hypothetical protein
LLSSIDWCVLFSETSRCPSIKAKETAQSKTTVAQAIEKVYLGFCAFRNSVSGTSHGTPTRQ